MWSVPVFNLVIYFLPLLFLHPLTPPPPRKMMDRYINLLITMRGPPPYSQKNNERIKNSTIYVTSSNSARRGNIIVIRGHASNFIVAHRRANIHWLVIGLFNISLSALLRSSTATWRAGEGEEREREREGPTFGNLASLYVDIF